MEDLNKKLVIELYGSGQSCVDLGRRFQCSHKAILKILHEEKVVLHKKGWKNKTKDVLDKECPICKKHFFVMWAIRKKQFCSVTCRNRSYQRRICLTCSVCEKDFERPASSKKNKKNVYCSMSCRSIGTQAILHNSSIKDYFEKVKPVIWKEQLRKRSGILLRRWKEECRKRDKNQCRHCGTEKGLCVHHIKSVRDYPDLVLEVANGITLCASCHNKEHHHADPNDSI